MTSSTQIATDILDENKSDRSFFSPKVIKFLQDNNFNFIEKQQIFAKFIYYSPWIMFGSMRMITHYIDISIEINDRSIILEINGNKNFEFRLIPDDNISNDDVFYQNFKKMADTMKDFIPLDNKIIK